MKLGTVIANFKTIKIELKLAGISLYGHGTHSATYRLTPPPARRRRPHPSLSEFSTLVKDVFENTGQELSFKFPVSAGYSR